MNPTTDEENLVRWLDGEMDAAEAARFEARLEADPVLKAEAMEMKAMTAALRQHLPQPGDIPHADFFNSQIQREIHAIKAEEAKRAAVAAPSFFGLLRMPWLAGAAAALLAVMAVTMGREARVTEVVSTYVPGEGIGVAVTEVPYNGGTLLLLDGLAEVPADHPVVGYSVHRSEHDARMAMTTLFGRSGEVLLVMAKDGADRLKMVTR